MLRATLEALGSCLASGGRDSGKMLLAASRPSQHSLGRVSEARADAGGRGPSPMCLDPLPGIDSAASNRDESCSFHSQTQGLTPTNPRMQGSREERQGATGNPALWAASPIIPKVALG